MSFNKFLLLTAAFAPLLFFPSCRRTPQERPPIRRLAVLPFEDHSVRASHAWLARLLPFSLGRQLAGAPGLQVVEARSSASLPDATHELSGFFLARDGALEAHLFLYDLPSHKLARHQVLSAPAAGWRDLLVSSARFLSSALVSGAQLQPLGVTQESAARRLAEALSANSVQLAEDAFRAASEADPACGWCWLGWAETAARRGGRDAALSALAAAEKHRASLDPLSQHNLALLAANLNADSRAAAAALEKIAAAAPSDPLAQARLAESLVALREYSKAVRYYRRAIDLDPRAAAFWNSLAYAEAWQGRFDDALKAVARYAELDASANPADSRGEILMMAGRFPEAFQAFDESYRKDPMFNNGAALEKAALCWLLQGDSRRTAETLARLIEDRARAGDRTVELRRARWEWLTGQSALARERFSRLAREASHPLAPIASSMLALRLSASDPSAAAAILRTLAPARDPMYQLYSLYAASGANPSLIDPLRDERLRGELNALSLTLRGDWPRAAAAWNTVLERSPGGSDGPYHELLAFCLARAGNIEQAAAALGASWPLLHQGQMEFYDFLVYPNLLFTRAEIARAQGRMDEARRLYDAFLQFAGDRADLAQQAARARAAARL
ncbi:MAG: tetratricopeptide repeat protein [Bryobacteraceae bacterium]